MLKISLILSLVLTINAWGVTICKHGAPQTLGIEKLPIMRGLPNLKDPTKDLRPLNSNNPFLRNKNFRSDDRASDDSSIKKRMKILILSATGEEAIEPSIELAKKILNNYGIPFDHHALTVNKEKVGSLPALTASPNEALYYGVILSTGLLAYANKEGVFQSALTADEWQTLRNFELKFNIRTISLYTFPNPTLGVSNVVVPSPNLAVKLEPTKEYLNLDSALKKDAEFELAGSWAYAAKIESDKATPVLFYENSFNPESVDKTVAAAITKTNDGREEMHFFFAQSKFFTSSIAISSAWVHWLTRGLYQGKRRVYMNVHIDDFFLSTGLFSPYEDPNTESYASEKFVYRLTDDDLALFAKTQNTELRSMLKNDDYRIEMAYNGNGIWEHGTYIRDSLFKKSKELVGDFYWLTHTFTHGDLNWFNYTRSKWEFTTNQLVAEDFFADNELQWFSPNSIVTPRISGLFNPNAITAMLEVGIQTAVGDNTRKELLPQNIHHGLFTTKDFNGKDGLFIIPRYATEIYYNVSLPFELAAEYNKIYSKFFGRDSTPQEILDREKTRVVRQLLSYEAAPYMFHQANLRSFPWGNTRESLVSLWIKNVSSELRRFLTLPILAAKMDDLSHKFHDRMAADNCESQVWQIEKNNELQALRVTSKKACPVWITGVKGSLDGWKKETYGPDVTLEKRFTIEQDSVYNLK